MHSSNAFIASTFKFNRPMFGISLMMVGLLLLSACSGESKNKYSGTNGCGGLWAVEDEEPLFTYEIMRDHQAVLKLGKVFSEDEAEFSGTWIANEEPNAIRFELDAGAPYFMTDCNQQSGTANLHTPLDQHYELMRLSEYQPNAADRGRLIDKPEATRVRPFDPVLEMDQSPTFENAEPSRAEQNLPDVDYGNYCGGKWAYNLTEMEDGTPFIIDIRPNNIARYEASDEPPFEVEYMWGNVEGYVEFPYRDTEAHFLLGPCDKEAGRSSIRLDTERGSKTYDMVLIGD